MVKYRALCLCILVSGVTCASVQTVAAQTPARRLPDTTYADAPPSPEATPYTKASEDRSSDDNAQLPDQRYAKAVAAMRVLAIPPFVTYRSAWTSNPLHFDISQDDKRLALSLGSGRDFKGEHTYSVSYRNVDRTLRVTEDDREAYEKRYAIAAPSPLEALHELMAANDLKQKDMVPAIASKGIFSEVMRGKRLISKGIARKLAARFKVSHTLFL